MAVKSLKLIVLSVILLVPFLKTESQNTPKYRVAVCDWMILKRQKLGEFALARQINADGVEMDMGPLGNRVLFDNRFRNAVDANVFKHTADSLGVEVPSIAMSGFFAQNFIIRENYVDLLKDCFNTMKIFNSKIAFLPLGGCGNDWKKEGAMHDSLVGRLHVAGEMALNRGFVVAIRTAMDAKYDIKLLKQINSKGVKIYYNFQDAADSQRDICKELKRLGRENIAQIHASNTDSVILKYDNEINLPKIKRTLDRMGWSGWLVVERSRDVKRVKDVKYNFGSNVEYLKEVFWKGNKLK